MNLEDKNNIVNKVRDFLMNEGLSHDEAVDAILDAEVIHLINWDDEHDKIRSVEDYAAEAYEFWKAKQN
jgi:hypothetical protein